MKLPFKIPSFKLPKFGLPKFGRKKADDDEDEDDDDDFDPSDFEADDDDTSSDDAPVSPAAEGGGGDGAGEETPPVAEAEGAEAPQEEAPGEATSETENGDKVGDGPDASEELEDIDFGDEDEDEDEDEEGGGKSKRKMLLIGGGAAGLLLIGGLSWFFLSGDGEAEKAAKEETGIPTVTMDIAPKKKMIAGNSLNAIAAGAKGPGAGVTVPVVSPMAFASLAPPPVIDGPLVGGDDPGLSEVSPQGPLPIIGEDGRMPWQVYAKPFEHQGAQPRVAIVVSGLGLSEIATDAAISLLPGNVTLAFDPYAPGLLDWVAKARQAGHEAMIMVPLEPSAFPIEDPGPQGQMTTNAAEENRLRLEYILSRTTSYIGVMTVMGSKFNTSEEHLRALLDEIKTRGLMFLEGSIDAKSLGPKLATEIGVPRALTDIIIDSIPTKAGIDDQLSELESILGKQPAVVAIAEAYPSSIERLAAWTATLESKNIILAPLSALADKQFLQ
ncbi:MAG: divergent polysaccharide deacetylase family protein [Rhodospirillales bacterium]|nr:divergent polysaccharide deacetylase family protein [Rhodospirillales bacterium]